MTSQKSILYETAQVQLGYSLGYGVDQIRAKPFIKWAGGKGQLIDKLSGLFPLEMKDGAIKKYAEPFIGGGAMFFYIAQKFHHIQSFFISDVNQELVLAYRTIQANVDALIDFLGELESKYHRKSYDEQKAFFYKTRNEFNEKLVNFDFEKYNEYWVERTGTIIFLNRTCFNGLFRVNSKGEFNVPFGDYKNPKICDSENLRAVSTILQKVQIVCGDFMASQKFIDAKTFVYFDPPYRPISKTASFTSYSKFDFDDFAQQRLAQYFASLSSVGAKLMLSNSDPKNENPDDHFFEEAFRDFRIERIDAARMINSVGNKRGKIKELIIMNY